VPKLTKNRIEKAQLPAGETDSEKKRWAWLGDSEVPGFGVKLYGNGRRTFALRYRNREGRQRMLTIGAFGTLTVQQARDIARKRKVEILEGADPRRELNRRRVMALSVGEMLSRWVDSYARVHRRRWEEDSARIHRHIAPALGQASIVDLTREAVASWHRALGRSTPVEANRCLETLRAAWRWAHAEGVLPAGVPPDPTSGVKRFRETSRDRWLTRAEIGRLIRAVDTDTDATFGTWVRLLLLTGLRKGELLGAKWADIDTKRMEIRLPTTKSGRPQVRTLPAPAIELLRGITVSGDSEFVFPSPDDPDTHRRDFKRQWRAARRSADLEDITLHDLRRTAGSHMAQAGVPLQTIAEVLGHSHPSVTRLYARLARANERDALNQLSDSLSEALGLGHRTGTTGLASIDRLRALLDADPERAEEIFENLERLGLGPAADA
jgi:integrase